MRLVRWRLRALVSIGPVATSAPTVTGRRWLGTKVREGVAGRYTWNAEQEGGIESELLSASFFSVLQRCAPRARLVSCCAIALPGGADPMQRGCFYPARLVLIYELLHPVRLLSCCKGLCRDFIYNVRCAFGEDVSCCAAIIHNLLRSGSFCTRFGCFH